MSFMTQLEQIIDSCKIIDLHTYSLGKTEHKVFNQQPWMQSEGDFKQFGANQLQDTEQQEAQLRVHLQNNLYGQYYCGINPDALTDPHPMAQDRQDFMQELSRHIVSDSSPDKGWRVYQIDQNSMVYTTKKNRLRAANPGTFQTPGGNAPVAVNQVVQFPRVKDNTTAQNAFYFVYSDTWYDHSQPQMRVYFNLKPEYAGLLIQLLSHTLNYYKVPFNFKCLNHPTLYKRRDSAVLYLEKHDFVFVIELLKQHVFPGLTDALNDASPLFTQELHPGVSYAEDPGNGNSFGMHRCQIIANALVAAWSKGIVKKAQRREFIINYLSDKGLTVDDFHLNKAVVSWIVSPQPQAQPSSTAETGQ